MGIISTIATGLVTGTGMYYVTKLFFDPILRYKEVIYRIDKNLLFYADARHYIKLKKGELDPDYCKTNEKVKKSRSIHREDSSDLKAAYYSLPRLYKGWLYITGVIPLGAAMELVGLSNTTDSPEDREYDRHERIRKYLRLHDEDSGERLSFKHNGGLWANCKRVWGKIRDRFKK